PSQWNLLSEGQNKFENPDTIFNWGMNNVSGKITLRIYLMNGEDYYAEKRVTINVNLPTPTPQPTITPTWPPFPPTAPPPPNTNVQPTAIPPTNTAIPPPPTDTQPPPTETPTTASTP